ncbi:MAG: hypothetical protein HY646_15860, partial [Acidobacteria bacterium]|nr:hypothetical protein [Acidobacteriota bacterium]
MISSYFEDVIDDEPLKLRECKNRFFNGSNIFGDGFYISQDEAQRLVRLEENYRQVIYPIMNGKEITSSPTQKPTRTVINFFDWSFEAASKFSEAFRIIENRVKPGREQIPRDTPINRHYHDHWWQYGVAGATLYRQLRNIDWCFALAAPSKYLAIARLPSTVVFTHAVRVFATDRWDLFAVVQSALHEVWGRKYSGALKQDLRYSPSNCFDNFPFPEGLWQTANPSLTEIGERYHEHRRRIMLDLWLGLTDTYNLFHARNLTPSIVAKVTKRVAEESESGYGGILELRRLHRELDNAVRDAYGWNDLNLEHDFHEVETLPENDRVRYTISPAARK